MITILAAGPLAVGRHLILYVVEDDRMVVTRILHQKVDVERHLNPESDA
ncbi:hypothetical protein BH24CHL4_BH24CHL4_18170 [soil metagenome]